MNSELLDLILRLENPKIIRNSVISWGTPIVSFGNPKNSQLATLGLNPSNREFVDAAGKELDGALRRFHTLNSLGITAWTEISEDHISSIAEYCYDYFYRNPYDGWFKRLDYLISGTSMSYYFPSGEACHLDLIPYATSCKWTDLTLEQRNSLLELTGDTLGILLRGSPIKLLVLNGQTVVDSLEKISNCHFSKRVMPSWTLPRKDSDGVTGYSYTGVIDSVGGIKLKREIYVLGYNHNIQSSFGVTTKVQTAIRNWITQKAKYIL